MFLNFSDSAKFADIASNLINGLGFGSNFSFWSSTIFESIKNNVFSAMGISPAMPYSIVGFFKIFGVNDFAVIATSFFYFILTLIFVYLLGKKIFKSKLVGALSTLAVGFNYDLIHYATNGASESPFIFEVVAGLYFASFKKKWANVVTVLFLILMYFTRPQAFIFMAGLIIYWLISRFGIKKGSILFLGVGVFGILVDKLIIYPLSYKYPLTPIFMRGLQAILTYSSSTAVSDSLRGAVSSTLGISEIAKKVFYNLYNFYKALPDIANPYLWGLFFVGIFRWTKDKLITSFKISSIFMLVCTFLVTAITIPFYRYLHPVIPLVYIIAIETLVFFVSKIFNKKSWIVIITSVIFFILCIGQTLGIQILDSRFEARTHNVGKPPVYVELSKILKENTDPDHVVITNLDTWGSWYGERKTIWFPLEPKQLIDPATGKIPFDAIYLTSYLIDDQNYYMGNDWREIFNNPNDSKKWTCDGCDEIVKEFVIKGVYSVNAVDNYERLDSKAILLVKQ